MYHLRGDDVLTLEKEDDPAKLEVGFIIEDKQCHRVSFGTLVRFKSAANWNNSMSGRGPDNKPKSVRRVLVSV